MARLLRGSRTISEGVSQTELDGFTGSTNIATLGTIGTGTWQGTTVAVNQGGTGAATHTANNVLIGAGTGAITSIAPGADGQVLTSTGTVWQSEAVSAGLSETSGTWTPANGGGSETWSVDTGQTTGDGGYWFKHGSLIFCFCSFVANITSAGEYMDIQGLPVAQKNNGKNYAVSTPFSRTYKASQLVKIADLGPNSQKMQVKHGDIGSRGYDTNFSDEDRITFLIIYEFE